MMENTAWKHGAVACRAPSSSTLFTPENEFVVSTAQNATQHDEAIVKTPDGGVR